jgi:multiple sugar transport system ATP-binding protein
MNFIDATIRKADGEVWVDADEFKFPLGPNHPAAALEGKPVTLGIRPEAIFDKGMDTHVKATDKNTFKAKVDVLEPLGHEYVAYLGAGKHSLIATIDTGTRVKEGQTADFIVNLDALHIFDAETEQAIR